MDEDPNKDAKIRECLNLLAAKADILASNLRADARKEGFLGIDVFLQMLDAKQISETMFELHQLLNILPEYRK